jgi:gamma-glutamyltranspeptidase
LAHERFGTLPLDLIFGPAIALCEDGFPLSHKLADSLREETVISTFIADQHTKILS